MIRFIIFAVASLLFAGCNTHFEEYSPSKAANTECCSLTVSIDEEATRTYVEDGLSLCWHADDRLSVFYGTSQNSEYKFTGKTGDKGGAIVPVEEKDETTGSSIDNILALYPYNGSAKVSSNGYITTTLPSVQYFANETFGKGANTMVASTESTEDTFLSFRNVCGYLKIKLYGEGSVKSIKLQGNNNEYVSGEYLIVAYYGKAPYMFKTNSCLPYIILDCDNGVVLDNNINNPTEFWFAIPPIEFSNGITITATDINGDTFVQTTDKAVTIERNTIQPMKAVEAKFSTPKCPNNEVWYTTSDDTALTGLPTGSFSEDYFGADITAHTYTNGLGVITFDGNVTKIGQHTFSNEDTLRSITIPDSATTIDYKAFDSCTSLVEVSVGSGVKSIGEEAFIYCDKLANINIPDSVTEIGVRAFCECSSLKSINLGNNVMSIGTEAFHYCDALTSVNLGKSLTTIGTYAFGSCTSLGSITLPDSLTAIDDGVFSNCSSLSSITIGSGVKSIGANAFKSCSAVTSIIIPDNVELIDEYAFSSCSALETVDVGNGVMTIGKRAFEYCKKMETITLGEKVASIGDGAMAYCSSLKSLFCKPKTPPTIGSYILSAVNSDYTIYVPKGCGSTYKAANGWSSYESRIKEYGDDDGGSSDEYDVVFVADYIHISYEKIGDVNTYLVKVGDKNFDSHEYGSEDGTYYVFDIYASLYSSSKVPNGTYNLSSSATAGTLYAGNGYYYKWTFNPFAHPNYLGYYDEATVGVTADGIDAVITMEDGTKHHVTYNGRPSL